MKRITMVLWMVLTIVSAYAKENELMVSSQTFEPNKLYYLYNVGSGKYYCAANNWGTQCSVGDEPILVMFSYYKENDTKTLLLKNFVPDKGRWYFAFFENDSQMFVDRASQANYGWSLRKVGDYYRLQASSSTEINPDYSSTKYPNKYVGLDVTSNSGNTALSPFLSVGTGHYIDWALMEVSDGITCELSSAGTLGVEVLYQVNSLNDVNILKVVGPMNNADWADIKKMNNLIALDLSEAIVSEIPNNAFDGKGTFYSVILPEGTKKVGDYAFRGTSLMEIQIPSTVVSIGNYAFVDVANLNHVTFAENSQLTSIGEYAFKGCQSLQEIIMPNSVTTLGKYGFYQCKALKSIHFSDDLNSLPERICSECTGLKEVHLPVGVKSIDRWCFNGAVFTTIDFPASLSSIGRESFLDCPNLQEVKLPLKLSTLDYGVFRNCSQLKYIELPSYVETYDRTFYNCDAIETVVCPSATPPSISQDPFQEGRAKNSITLKVPSFAVANYKLDSYWYQFGSIIEGDDIDYWKLTGPLSLTNNRRMNGKPDIDLYYGGKLTVAGNAPMEVGQFNIYVNGANPGCLLNTCDAMTADDINTYYSVSSETWYFFTPLYDVNLANVAVSNNASYVFRYYDGSSRANKGMGNSWRNVDNGKLIAGQGYIFRCDKDAILTMPSGVLNPIAPMANEKAWNAKVSYTTQHGLDWTSSTFDDSSWEIQQAAWGTPNAYPNVNNAWTAENSDIYVRRTVNLTADDLNKNLWIRFSHDDSFELYINGKLIINTGYTWMQGETHRLSVKEKQNLRVGENIIAAHCHNYGSGAYIDFGLYNKSVASPESLASVLRSSDATKQLSAHNAAVPANKNWNYIGNPYPCYYDIYYMDFTAPITVWNGNTYDAYSIVDDKYVLRPMQSFFVQKPDAVDNIVFHKEGRQLTTEINHASNVRVHRGPSHANRYLFNLQIIGDEQMDKTRVVINGEALLGYEMECDAFKFMSFNAEMPQLFTLDEEENTYAINERPFDNGIVKMAYYSGAPGFLTISSSRADGEIYLRDNLLNKTINLNEQDYTFYSDETDGANTTRFTLMLKVKDVALDITEVENEASMRKESIYDLQGRKVPVPTKKGIYIQNGHKVVK